ncbi:hypothetical protein P3T73_12370 [Kiritimatiellota bacterium B12222]|nr:hypothetical protein P3T73_12370 [Kiritimatiellota bacterium B12222]
MDEYARKIGDDLIRASETEGFTAQRSVIEELFPYIYVASRRMSLRAISRWLNEAHDVKLSQVAISRAMKDQEKHWERMADSIQPSATIYAECHGEDPIEILQDEELFKRLLMSRPENLCEGVDDPDPTEKEYFEATRTLENDWFSLPEAVRNQCNRHLAFWEA